MEQLVPNDTTLVIANVLPSGAAFAVRLDNGDNCYVPAGVSRVVNAQIGDEYSAKIVPNRYPDKVDRTPWLAVHLSRPARAVAQPQPVQYAMPFEQFDIEPPPPPVPTIAERVRALMHKGGVWTVASLFEELAPGKARIDSITEYNAISAAIRGMYAKGECAKFQLWRSYDQSKPSREWFTCFPDKADVDEWEE